MRNTDRIEDLPPIETPEDVAVLYSWANLHGAKYRDFSASRREYRAQLRHRAAEQVRETELHAQVEAEAAAESAEAVVREAERAAQDRQEFAAESTRLEALRQAEEAARIASAERIEAARRSEAAALAEAIALREEREIADAHASARRQSARYADSERHRRQLEAAAPRSTLPGQISDPYTPLPQQAALLVPQAPVPAPLPAVHLEPVRRMLEPTSEPERSGHRPSLTSAEPPEDQIPQRAPTPATDFSDGDVPPSPPVNFRARGYRPDDASGVRRIVRSPEFDDAGSSFPASPVRPPSPPSRPSQQSQQMWTVPRPERGRSANVGGNTPQREWAESARQPGERPSMTPDRPYQPGVSTTDNLADTRFGSSELPVPLRPERSRPSPPAPRSPVISPFSQQPLASARALQSAPPFDDRQDPSPARTSPPPPRDRRTPSLAPDLRPRTTPPPTPAEAPAWLYESKGREAAGPDQPAGHPQTSVSDTLQQSRERVASRWFALKGVFEQPGSGAVEPPPRQKETRTPVLAVFSLAGGVGKTSLVATLGRSLSSLGEKVLLTDTTTHGLLPFYFGASELRQGAVRTFSPPSGSTDAPIYLVSYDADARRNDESAEETLAEEIATSGRGTHRVLLDLSAASSWVIRRLARSNPTILVPVAPDMNSVISLHTVEKLLADVTNADGQPAQVYFLLNHFDAALPLHLDVREVLRRQLGERLLPFVIRRAPVVSEALAEGMTVVDYAPEEAVAEDYLHVANWLRTLAAPATAGFRNVRWSER